MKWAQAARPERQVATPRSSKSRTRQAAARAVTSTRSTRRLAKYETVKQFAILPKDLTVDEGELTPSLKVKRKVVEKKYAGLLDKMYEGAVAAAD